MIQMMHFLNVVQCYWHNPDLNAIGLLGKDIRTILAVSCQKIFFERNHPGFYHYGPIDMPSGGYSRGSGDLQVRPRLAANAPDGRGQHAPMCEVALYWCSLPSSRAHHRG